MALMPFPFSLAATRQHGHAAAAAAADGQRPLGRPVAPACLMRSPEQSKHTRQEARPENTRRQERTTVQPTSD